MEFFRHSLVKSRSISISEPKKIQYGQITRYIPASPSTCLPSDLKTEFQNYLIIISRFAFLLQEGTYRGSSSRIQQSYFVMKLDKNVPSCKNCFLNCGAWLYFQDQINWLNVARSLLYPVTIFMKLTT